MLDSDNTCACPNCRKPIVYSIEKNYLGNEMIEKVSQIKEEITKVIDEESVMFLFM